MLSALRNSVFAPSVCRALASKIELANLELIKTETPKEKLPNDQLAFGMTFSDHMLEVDWNAEKGWSNPVIRPYGDLALSPAASSLHYGLECFEGMKAYRDADDQIRLFRPEMNMSRLNRSMSRLYLPQFDEAGFLECIKELVKLEKDWVPGGDGYSLYMRPTAISTHPFLGIGPAANVKLYCILSPVGPYYASGFKPIKLLADSKYSRAFPGGTGDVKVGGNYGPTILPQVEAAAKGYSQVLWLFGEDEQVTEVGCMNFFVLWTNEEGEKELITAPLDGTILPGITRRSVLDLAIEWGEFKVSEKSFTMPQFAKALKEGRVVEAFGTGTAAIVCPVDGVSYQGVEYEVPVDAENPDAVAGKLTQRVWDSITGIQYGKVESDWSVVL